MATVTATAKDSQIPLVPHPQEMRVYMHSGLLYWWPVWFVGFVMAAWTLIDNQHMVLVPAGSVVEGNTVTTPAGTAPVVTPVHLAGSRVPGMAFVLTLLAVVVCSGGWMRGWRAYTFAVSVVAVILLVSYLDEWDTLAVWASYLQVHLNLGGYLLISTAMLLFWLVQFFLVDRQRYVVFSPSQVRVHNHVGEQEQAFDTGGIAFEKEPYDWFRRLVGFGSGDLRVRVGGQWVEIPNVIHVGRRLDAIETLLRIKDVD